MSPLHTWSFAAIAALFITGCNCVGEVVISGDGGEDAGSINLPPTGDGGGGGGGNDGGGETGTADAGPPVNPGDPKNANKDTDCDGLTDAEEFANVYAGMKKTDPAVADTDGDGIKDGVELGRTTSVDAACGFVGDVDPATKTLPTEADSDSDAIPDGLEDANRNGGFSVGETDPNSPDSDGDKLFDGVEDANLNGTVDVGETDPRARDTDQDGINDGVEKTTTLTDPTKADTDGDMCPDGIEDGNQNGVKDPGETDPKNGMDCGPNNIPDADMDGIPDMVEDSNLNGVWDQATETNFQNPDTDGDGLKDGVEDKNRNGYVNAGETNPRRKDTDCDGLIDGPNAGAVLGEDLNGNGALDMGETDPTRADSDGDGITDGVELGLTVPADPTHCVAVPVDADPSTTTDPNDNDSDNDGIPDGAEDTNQNGKVDTGELNPKDGTDGMGPAGQVCTVNNLKPVVFKEEGQPDLQLALPSSFTELSTMMVGGTPKGLIGYDPTSKVAFVAYRTTPPGANVTADETTLRSQLNAQGTLSNPVTQSFTSWDGFPSLLAFYDQAGAADVKARANAIANALVGAGAGALAGAAGVSGPFKLQAQYVRRSANSLVVLVALVPASANVEPAIFTVADTAGGSALAQFGDANAVQCETFAPGASKVDFLFVVDDSCSMASSQTSLASAANAMEAALQNSTLDWRIALVSTSYQVGGEPNSNVLRGFTTDINQFKAWLTQNSDCIGNICTGVSGAPACGVWGGSNSGCWVNTNGNIYEALLGTARKAVDDITPGGSKPQKRADAELIIVLLGDAEDQTTGYTTVATSGLENVQNLVQYFTGTGTSPLTRNKLNKVLQVSGIICPQGMSCNGEFSLATQRTPQVITATGGIRGDILTQASIQTSMTAIVNNAIAAAGYKTKKPPIGTSVKVAMDVVSNGANCNANNIPRSRVNGFDFSGLSGTVSFFGDCRPGASSKTAAVSYRYWIDTTPNPDGNPPPCFNDPFFDPNAADYCSAKNPGQGDLVCNKATGVCECPANCGGTPPPGKVCDPNKLVCNFVCTPDCGGTCFGYQTCDPNSCACACVQSATCAPGYTFVNNGTLCGCFCDTAQLSCGATYDADLMSCSCVCKPDCGTCASGTSCNLSSCSCGGGIG